MPDSELVKKILRSVLQSSKAGVPIDRVDAEYRLLCGETIPVGMLGFSNLEDYLRSIPSVVRMEYRRGELTCFAEVCEETTHIAELVAKQKNSKKSRSRLNRVSCRKRPKFSISGTPNDTWLNNNNMPESVFKLHERILFRADRDQQHSGKSRGGGLCIYINKVTGDFNHVNLQDIRPKFHQHSSVEKQGHHHKDHLCVANGCCVHVSTDWQMFRAAATTGSNVDLEEYSSTVHCYIRSCIDNMTTSKTITIRPNQKPWMTRKFDQSLSSITPVEKRQPAALQAVNQCVRTDRMKNLWADDKKPSGKAPEKISRCITSKAEQGFGFNKADCLDCPHLHPKLSACSGRSAMNIFCKSQPVSSSAIIPILPLQTPNILSSSVRPKPEVPSKNILPELAKLSSPVTLCSPATKPGPTPSLSSCETLGLRSGCNNSTTDASLNCFHLHNGSENLNCTTPIHQSLLKSAFSSSNSISTTPSDSSVALPDEVRQRLKKLLGKYNHGVWAHALPKLFMDTFKVPFPEHLLSNLSLFLDICSIDYPIPHDKNKAILYLSPKANTVNANGQETLQHKKNNHPNRLEVIGPVAPPSLVPPPEQNPSVLVNDAKSTTAATVSKDSAQPHVINPAVGQLVSARLEEGGRAQVMDIMALDKVKVYNVDDCFSLETRAAHLWELCQDVLSLSVQATNVITTDAKQTLMMPPPPLELPTAGENVDVFVSVACHPGYFVIQLWQDLHKLAVLMGEMVIYYNQNASSVEPLATDVRKGDICAAQIGKGWYRVMVEGILTNRLASVYDLDRGKRELICFNLLRPLIQEFRQLPFQAVTAQLAGVTQHHWSEKSAMLFRNHVEQRALVAHVASVLEESKDQCDLQEPRLTVYLVDTTVEDRDVWIHTLMANIDDQSSAAKNSPAN
ncbi:tudor domain-containing protein 7A-like [Thalassophryne amazonica]|uniref:tudor domain-containing protein 7A-like n=1 Tax=Thalassophryne amazonica TaxID=390379 RepID=UPI0014718126|nr:tudor domain-containing protein 7A-like [Thalassophryne amazonica]